MPDTLVIMDIIVWLKDGSITTVEVQRYGYAYPKDYIHRFHQVSDTGLQMNLLEEYIFVPLDILKKIVQNKKKISDLEAWLAFFCIDDPKWILKLSENYPRFREMYREIYEICRDLEGVMQMYSKELQKLDSNTVQYMIDQMQETINQKEAQLNEKAKELSEKDEQLSMKDKQLSRKDEQLNEKDDLIAKLQSQLQEMQKHLSAHQ